MFIYIHQFSLNKNTNLSSPGPRRLMASQWCHALAASAGPSRSALHPQCRPTGRRRRHRRRPGHPWCFKDGETPSIWPSKMEIPKKMFCIYSIIWKVDKVIHELIHHIFKKRLVSISRAWLPVVVAPEPVNWVSGRWLTFAAHEAS